MQELITIPTIVEGLNRLGVSPGMTLLMHCSLARFGHVQGGAQTIIEALMETVGEAGTIVMPTLTDGRFDPSEWSNPPVAAELWDRIRFETPLYDARKTPVDHTMSIVYELFRSWPGVVRTAHPHSSVAAWGRHRDEVVKVHKLEDRFGESSPLARLYDLNGYVLLLGTTHATNTCFHLAEYRLKEPARRKFKIVLEIDGKRALHEYSDVDTDSSVFQAIGEAYESAVQIKSEAIGHATCRLFPVREAVDFALGWLVNASAGC